MFEPLRDRHLHRQSPKIVNERQEIRNLSGKLRIGFLCIADDFFTERKIVEIALAREQIDLQKIFIRKAGLTDPGFHHARQRDILIDIIRKPRQIEHDAQILLGQDISEAWSLCRNAASHQNLGRRHGV